MPPPPSQAGRRWAIGFVLLAVLSLDYWAWGWPTGLGPFGLPWWIYYFGLLQLVLAAAMFRFAGGYWRDDSRDDP